MQLKGGRPSQDGGAPAAAANADADDVEEGAAANKVVERPGSAGGMGLL